jgi:NADPH:quinone reductase-like Zn-dependent oxidoreductase
MNKIILVKYGRKNCYKFEKHESDLLSDNQVRIKIRYIGISFTDYIIKRGNYKYQKEYFPLPFVQGFEFGGSIIEVKNKNSEYKIGDEIVGINKFGCFQTEICINEKSIIKIPNEYSLLEATSFPVNFFTAYHALHNLVVVNENSKVLITSGAGGVGSMLIQLCKISKHQITSSVSSSSKIDYVKGIGADKVIVGENLNNEDKDIDIVFDSSGTFNPIKYKKCLSTNPKIIVYGFNSLLTKNIFRNIFNYFNLYKPRLFDMVYNNITVSGFNIIKFTEDDKYFEKIKNEFSKLLESKQLKVPKIRLYNYKEVNKAIESLTDRSNIGKVILEVTD